MKNFIVAVAVAVMLTIVCLQESSAAPSTEEHKQVEETMDGGPVAVYEEISEGSRMMSYDSVQRQRRCRFCCSCCPNMTTCGVCCRFGKEQQHL
uniref:Hepcidin n=1 Tax=Nothobranchius kuhntae TaxID=321403 RepID=A0A1A8HYQ6_NOTKU